MTSIYLENFSELLLLKYNENAVFVFSFKLFFIEKWPFCYFMFIGYPYILEKSLDKVYNH